MQTSTVHGHLCSLGKTSPASKKVLSFQEKQLRVVQDRKGRVAGFASLQTPTAGFGSTSNDVPTNPVRVVLLGRTGAGKSLLGNKLVGQESFTVGGAEASSTTQSVLTRQTKRNLPGPPAVVVDTPGLDSADTRSPVEEPASTSGQMASNVSDIRNVNMVVTALKQQKGGAVVVLFLAKFGDVFTKSDQVMLRRYLYCLRDESLWRENFAIVFTHAFAGYVKQNQARAQSYAEQVGNFMADALDCAPLQPTFFYLDTPDPSSEATVEQIRSWLASCRGLVTQPESLIHFQDDRKWKRLREERTDVIKFNFHKKDEMRSVVANSTFEYGAVGALLGLLTGALAVTYRWSRHGFPALLAWLSASPEPVFIVQGTVLGLTVVGMCIGAYWVREVGTAVYTVTTWEEKVEARTVWQGVDGNSEYPEDWTIVGTPEKRRTEETKEVLMPEHQYRSQDGWPAWRKVLQHASQAWAVVAILAFLHRVLGVVLMLLGIQPLVSFFLSMR